MLALGDVDDNGLIDYWDYANYIFGHLDCEAEGGDCLIHPVDTLAYLHLDFDANCSIDCCHPHMLNIYDYLEFQSYLYKESEVEFSCVEQALNCDDCPTPDPSP